MSHPPNGLFTMGPFSEKHVPESPNKRVIAEFRANGGRVGGYFSSIPLLTRRRQESRTFTW